MNSINPVFVIVPAFNEEKRLDQQAFLEFLQQRPEFRFIFVDDCSTDRTLQVLKGLAARSTSIEVVALPQNQGKAEATRQGVLHALKNQAAYFAYWDADLATPLDELPRFLKVFNDHPSVLMVSGARVKLLGKDIRRKKSRHYLGRLFATGASLALNLPVYDTQCGAKMFRVHLVTKNAFMTPFISRWIFDIEIFARILSSRDRKVLSAFEKETYFFEMPLNRWEDVGGSKLKLRDFVRACFELARIAITYRKSQSLKPKTELSACND